MEILPQFLYKKNLKALGVSTRAESQGLFSCSASTMQHVNIEKIEAINRYRKQQLLRNIFIYSLTAITCSSPFWYPPLCSVMKAFLFVSLPQISSLFFNPKFLFILGNLIVVFLVGESKILSAGSSSASDVYYNEYVCRKQSIQSSPNLECKGEKNIVETFQEKVKSIHEDGEENVVEEEAEAEAEDLDGNQWLSLPTEEINKRADDFIARVNEQRRLEVIQLVCSSD